MQIASRAAPRTSSVVWRSCAWSATEGVGGRRGPPPQGRDRGSGKPPSGVSHHFQVAVEDGSWPHGGRPDLVEIVAQRWGRWKISQSRRGPLSADVLCAPLAAFVPGVI